MMKKKLGLEAYMHWIIILKKLISDYALGFVRTRNIINLNLFMNAFIRCR